MMDSNDIKRLLDKAILQLQAARTKVENQGKLSEKDQAIIRRGLLVTIGLSDLLESYNG